MSERVILHIMLIVSNRSRLFARRRSERRFQWEVEYEESRKERI